MHKLKINQDIRPMSEVRKGMASFIKQIRLTKRPLIITQHGKGVAVLMDAYEYEMMQDKLELLSEIQTSLKQLENGEGVNHNDAKEHVLQRALP